MAGYEIEFKDKVLDNVHGFIGLTEVESKICELPIFKRLRHLKQLSLANWVFPGAEHTRYIHSLGVMHVIDKMAIKLGYDGKERQLVRLAGLLHDLGHYPLSHVGEASYKNDTLKQDDMNITQQLKENVKKSIENLSLDINKFEYMTVSNNPYHHERITRQVILNNNDIRRIISESECADFIDLKEVCAIITGDVDYKTSLSDKVQLLHSELDADRIDYLMRDATFSGTSYGAFDLGLLLDNLTIRKYNGVNIVGVKPKGIASADQFLMNRFFSYSQVIFNKHVSILGFMAQKVMEYALTQKILPSKKRLNDITIDDSEKMEYLRFTDNKFWNTVDHLYNSVDDEDMNKDIASFVKALVMYNDLEHSDASEIRLITNSNDAYKSLIQSNIYKNCSNTNDCKIPMFNVCSITNHVPLDTYISSIKTNDDDGEELIELNKIRRLQDGLAVIDEDNNDIHLLVDDDRSLIKTMYNTKLYVLREYIES